MSPVVRRADWTLEPVAAVPFPYRWPYGRRRPPARMFDSAFAFRATRGPVTVEVRGGWFAREANGRVRDYIGVFVFRGATPYPASEFFETDLRVDRFAAVIPAPTVGQKRRAYDVDLPALRRVAHLRHAELARLDDVVDGKKEAPSLFVVAHEDDYELMARHGLWTAGRRSRL